MIQRTTSITNRNEEESLTRYFSDIAATRPLTIEEEYDLAVRIHCGDHKAFEKLVTSNLRFVISVAKEYQNRGLGLADLIEEGNEGLMKAANRFDETKGYRFITYAEYWIRDSISKALKRYGKMFQVQVKFARLKSQVEAMRRQIEQRECRPATIEEIAEELNMPISEIEDIIDTRDYQISLDDDSFKETPKYADILDSYDMDESEYSEELDILIRTSLSERDAYIITSSFGIGTVQLDDKEIAMELGTTRERVRIFRDRAINKMKNYEQSFLFLCS